MRVAVSAEREGLDAEVSSVLGRCPYFVFVDTETMHAEPIANAAANAPGGAGVQAAQAIVQRGADAVISGNVGPNAVQVLNAAGIRLYSAQGTVRDAVLALRDGHLTPTTAHTVAEHAGIAARPAANQPQPSAARAEELAQLCEQAAALRRQLADLLERIDALSKEE